MIHALNNLNLLFLFHWSWVFHILSISILCKKHALDSCLGRRIPNSIGGYPDSATVKLHGTRLFIKNEAICPYYQNISILSIEPKNWQTAVLKYMFPNPYGIVQAPLWANFLGSVSGIHGKNSFSIYFIYTLYETIFNTIVLLSIYYEKRSFIVRKKIPRRQQTAYS